MERLFEGKVVLVTSAAYGVEPEVAFSFAANGAFVVVSDTIDNGTAAKITDNGGEAIFIKTDVNKAYECKKLVQKIIRAYGKIDIAFNNAGMVDHILRLIDTYLPGIIKPIAPNANSVFYCIKYEMEAMRQQQQGGVIINLSSLTGSISPTSPHTRFSHDQGVSGIQNEMLKNSDKAIRIKCIVPGFVDATFPETFNLKFKQEIFHKHKKDRPKQPEQIVELVMWLSSEKASFSTRACFPEYVGYMAN